MTPSRKANTSWDPMIKASPNRNKNSPQLSRLEHKSRYSELRDCSQEASDKNLRILIIPVRLKNWLKKIKHLKKAKKKEKERKSKPFGFPPKSSYLNHFLLSWWRRGCFRKVLMFTPKVSLVVWLPPDPLWRFSRSSKVLVALLKYKKGRMFFRLNQLAGYY